MIVTFDLQTVDYWQSHTPERGTMTILLLWLELKCGTHYL